MNQSRVRNVLSYDPDQEFDGIGYIRQSDEREDKEDISEKTQLKKNQPVL